MKKFIIKNWINTGLICVGSPVSCEKMEGYRDFLPAKSLRAI